MRTYASYNTDTQSGRLLESEVVWYLHLHMRLGNEVLPECSISVISPISVCRNVTR